MAGTHHKIQAKIPGMALVTAGTLPLDAHLQHFFLLPTLLFIAQLEHPPKATLLAETRAQKSIAAGPKDWCRMQDLQHLKDLGPEGDQ